MSKDIIDVALIFRKLIVFMQYFGDLLFLQIFIAYWKLRSSIIKKNRKKFLLPRLFWGPIPIANNKYWSEALAQKGHYSKTFMMQHYAINKKDDFDFYVSEIKIKGKKRILNKLTIFSPLLKRLLLLDHALHNFDIFHIPFSGGVLFKTKYWELEAKIIKSTGGKIVVMPYGGDYWRYSSLIEKSYQHGMLINYPQLAKQESLIQEKVNFWTSEADCMLVFSCIDGASRWDALPFNGVVIDTDSWKEKTNYNNNDGKNGIVKIAHSPNHRGVKGTEFIIDAVNKLKKENLNIELILLEKKPNQEVRRIFFEDADILVEQLTLSLYGLNGIEGMASGLPVLTNLEEESRTRPFRRYSYLNECPILSSNPENIIDNLRVLISNPRLRHELGTAGRAYAEKYHSYTTAQFMFGEIYKKIWFNKEVDLLNLFHPLLENSYNNQSEIIKHPLVENKLPESYKLKLS